MVYAIQLATARHECMIHESVQQTTSLLLSCAGPDVQHRTRIGQGALHIWASPQTLALTETKHEINMSSHRLHEKDQYT